MGNYFETITGNSEVETVGGVFQCQEHGCVDIVEEASYNDKQSLLYWVCEEGHKNRVEGFNIS